MNCVKCGKPVEEDRELCGSCDAPPPKTALRFADEEPTLVALHANEVLDGKWRLERKLGEGGMGTVYLAHDLQLDRKVAIKVLANALSGDAGLVARFEREAKLTASLEHPNIVPVYAVGKFGNRPFIVMKKLEGRTLAIYLRETGPLASDEVMALMRQLCAGIDFIHARGFIHRDIKTGNIFIGPDKHATILDFGILRANKNDEALTNTGIVIGTPHYMSPEQALGVSIDHRADLYALAVVLFECLTGTLPFEGESQLSLIQMQAHAPAPEVIDRAPWVPRLVSDVLKRALAKNPEERYGSAGEFLAALEDALAGKFPAPVTLQPGEAAEGAISSAPSGLGEEPFTQLSRKRIAGQVKGTGPVFTPPSVSSPVSPPVAKPDTVMQAQHVRKSRAPIYIGAVATIALLGLATAFVHSLAVASSTVDSARKDPVSIAVKDSSKPEAPQGGEDLPPVKEPIKLSDPSLVSTEPPVKPDTEEADLAGEEKRPSRHEPKTRFAKDRVVSHSTSRLPGSLNVVTTLRGESYWAWVLIDGVDRGKTPLNVELLPGVHRVHIERAGFRPVDRQIRVASKRLDVLRIELAP